MADLIMRTLEGGTTAVPAEDVESLRASVRGAVCRGGEPGYDEGRRLWNATIERGPGLVVRCRGAADVMRAVSFARERRLLLSVKGAGHNIAGSGVCDGGLAIDLSLMTGIRVDADLQRVRVEPGVTLGELDRETQAHGLAVPLGINSTTGVAGLTLGGGFGWITRKFGMTVDNLVEADVVTADGRLVHASQTENGDLFWALRGGGGNFGVVTSFEFQAHPVGPEVTAGLIVHPFNRAGELLRRYRELAEAAPDELTCWAVLRKAPPLPFLPESWHGREVVVLAMCHVGDAAAGEAAVAPFRQLGTPIADVVGPHAFADWQAAFDPLLTPGARNYWKSHDFIALSDGAIDTLIDYAGRLPGPECEIFVAHVGGAMSRVPTEATAYPQRQGHFIMNVHTRWRDAAEDERMVGWARAFFDAAAPHAAGTVYVNFMPEDEGDRTLGAYGANLARLSRIKADWDPGNLFRHNQNIPPAAAAEAAGE